MSGKTEKIVAAARLRFRYYGLAKTTMQEIAQDAGVAVGTLYLYFNNKDALIVACAEEFVEHHRQQIAEILGADGAADEKLRAYVLARFRQSEETRTSSRHASEIARAVLRVKPDRIQEEGQMMWDVITRLLHQGVEQKLFRIAEPQRDAKVFLYSLALFFPNPLVEPSIPPIEEDLLMVTDWFVEAWKGKRQRANPRLRAG